MNAAGQGSCEDAAVRPTNLSELRHPRQAAISSFREEEVEEVEGRVGD